MLIELENRPQNVKSYYPYHEEQFNAVSHLDSRVLLSTFLTMVFCLWESRTGENKLFLVSDLRIFRTKRRCISWRLFWGLLPERASEGEVSPLLAWQWLPPWSAIPSGVHGAPFKCQHTTPTGERQISSSKNVWCSGLIKFSMQGFKNTTVKKPSYLG